MKHINALFSFSVMAASLVAAGGSYLMLTTPIKAETARVEAPHAPPAPIPSVEVPPPDPMILSEVVIAAPKNTVKPAPIRAKVALPKPPTPKQFLCEENWQDSAIGGRYKRCDWK